MAKVDADEAQTDAELVRWPVRRQFPQWGDLPVERLASGGTVNAVYRLGETLTVRLPRYRHANPIISADARHAIGEILTTKEAATWPPSSR